MPTNLTVYGPYEVPVGKNGTAKFIDKPQKDEFLELIEDEGLSEKDGCYIFALRAGRGYTPYYIGKATKGMRTECMQPHKLNHYNAVMHGKKNGTPVMFFVALAGNLKNVSSKICDEMESHLIHSALRINPELRNVQGTKNLPTWGINGVLRSKRGQPTNEAEAFRKMMGL